MQKTAQIIQQKIDELLAKDSVSIMLTGGKSAKYLYNAWKKLPNFKKIINTTFYFGDERCVPEKHPDSNYTMAMQSLFSAGIPNNCKVVRMKAESKDLKKAANEYATLLPDSIDILILSVGEDGHIASLFPHSPLLHEQRYLCMPVITPKVPYKRLTITPVVVQKAKLIFMLAYGDDKVKIMHKAQQNLGSVDELPVRLVSNAIWCLN